MAMQTPHHFNRLAFFAFLLIAWLSGSPLMSGETVDDKPAEPIKTLILPGESFKVADRPAFILWPEKELRRSPQPWVFYAPTLPAYPDSHEKWMHEQFLAAGIAVAGIDVGEAYGSPASRKLFDAFYEDLTSKRGMAKKPCLLGRSRGGLWVTAWACDHPERFSGLAGIYPVFDFKTYPGLEAAAPAYQMSAADLEKNLDQYNPILRMSVIAKAKLPALMIHGDEDAIVPLKENSATFAETYQRHGAEKSIRLIVVPGQGHNYWEGFFRCQELVDFVIERAKSDEQ
jgi:dipeptidyl aminopeptidase/acylaminoacyl peptidase